MRKVKKVIDCIISIILYPAFAAIIAMLILFLIGIKPYITMSGSMEPEIHTGSICFVDTNAEYADVEVGDVIAYKSSLGLVTHRVIAITAEGLETQGDANTVSDGISTTAANFHGKTLFSVPYIGYAVKYLQQPTIMAIVIILIIGTTALSFVGSDDKEKKKEETVGDGEEPEDPAGSRAQENGETESHAECDEVKVMTEESTSVQEK